MLQQGQTGFEQLRSALGRRRGHVRLLLEEDEGALIAKRLVADFAPRSSEERNVDWNYGSVLLVSGGCLGGEMASWLDEMSGRLGQHEFAILEWQRQISWQRHPSNSPSTTAPLRWPFTEYSIMATGSGMSKEEVRHTDFMIGRGDAPSFENVNAGAYEFLWGEPFDQPRSLPSGYIVRVANTDAWIDHVRLGPSSMAVTVRGKGPLGARLELVATATQHQGTFLRDRKPIVFGLPYGLPDRAQLVLSKEGEWRDDRYVGPAYRLNRKDFSWETGDRSTDLLGLITSGEGAQTEFKREMPSSEEARVTVLKTVAAFANGSGGNMLIGVGDDGALMGVPRAGTREAIANMIKDRITPAPPFDTALIRVGSSEILLVTVQAGPTTPYAVRRAKGTTAYHVRRGATTFPAEPHEIRGSVLARQPQVQQAGRFGAW